MFTQCGSTAGEFGIAERTIKSGQQWTITYQGCELIVNGKPRRTRDYLKAIDMLRNAYLWHKGTLDGTYISSAEFVPHKGQPVSQCVKA